MAKKVYVPVTLDVDRLIEGQPPVGIKNFSKDKLLYIIHSVTYLQTFRDNLKVGGGFVPMHSAYLQNVAGIRNYNEYLEYLEKVGVLASIKSFTEGSSCVYKLRPPYDAYTTAVELTDKRFIKSLERDTRKQEAIAQYKNLWKWFSHGNLTIAREQALEYLRVVYPLNGSKEHLALAERNGDWLPEDFTHRHYMMRRIIENIHEGDPDNFHFTVDSTAGRLHTVLTNMKKDFRNFLSYGGRPLASCDVKCCQPYLSLLLFKPEFYQLNLRGVLAADAHVIKSLHEGRTCLNENILMLKSINFYKNNYTNFLSKSVNMYSTITLVKQIVEDTENALFEDVERYKQDILVKDFYSELRDGFNAEYGLNCTRDDMKGLWSAVAFGKVKHLNNRYTSDFHRYFARRYPTVLKLYDLLKAEKHQNMAHLLQRIEAHLMLKVISKRITKLKPRVPLFSIHDSLVTTTEHVEFVRSVMQEELDKLVGEKAKLETEYWRPEALSNKLLAA